MKLTQNKEQTVYVTISKNTLAVFNEEAWEELWNKNIEILKKEALETNKTLPDLAPYFNKCFIDMRGRITLPKWLANKVSIRENDDVSCFGLMDHFEIANPVIAHAHAIYFDVRYIKKQSDEETLPPLVFLSYSWKDWNVVEETNSLLMNLGYRTFLDRKDVIPGEYIYDKIQNSIDMADYYLFFASQNAVESEWCSRELSQALEVEVERKKTFIIPLKLDSVKMPGMLRNKKYINMQENKNTAFEELRDTLFNQDGYDETSAIKDIISKIFQ